MWECSKLWDIPIFDLDAIADQIPLIYWEEAELWIAEKNELRPYAMVASCNFAAHGHEISEERLLGLPETYQQQVDESDDDFIKRSVATNLAAMKGLNTTKPPK